MKKIISNEFKSHLQTIKKTISNTEEQIEIAALEIVKALKNKNKIIIFGNGGSAADAQHFAAELTGRYKTERVALPAIAITTDTSALTAIGNDYGYEKVFSRQIEAYAKSGDILVGISTSGNSKNILNGFKLGKNLECFCIGLSGNNGGDMNSQTDVNIVIPSNNTPRIQEMHILVIHTICQIVDNNF